MAARLQLRILVAPLLLTFEEGPQRGPSSNSIQARLYVWIRPKYVEEFDERQPEPENQIYQRKAFTQMVRTASRKPLLGLQLVMWAFGQFITNLPSNAIVMARVSGKDLSNVAAFTGMLSQVGMLLGYALLLAVQASSTSSRS